jgi:hypothetical protein
MGILDQPARVRLDTGYHYTFLRVSWTRSPTWKHALASIDYLGNAIFIASIVSVLLGLIQGGTIYPWSSWRTILLIVLGFVGWMAFFVQQAYCKEPTMPLRLFSNRTLSHGLFVRIHYIHPSPMVRLCASALLPIPTWSFSLSIRDQHATHQRVYDSKRWYRRSSLD